MYAGRGPRYTHCPPHRPAMQTYLALRAALLLVVLALAAAADAKRLRWTIVQPGTNGLRQEAPQAGLQRFADRGWNSVYVGRVFHRGAILPAAVSHNGKVYTAEFAFRNETVTNIDAFEILQSSGSYWASASSLEGCWEPAARGAVPAGSALVGVDADGGPLYACRVLDRTLTSERGDHTFLMSVGVLSPADGVCEISFHGVRRFTTYEVLCSD